MSRHATGGAVRPFSGGSGENCRGCPGPTLQDRTRRASSRDVRGAVGASKHPTKTRREDSSPISTQQRTELRGLVYIVAHGETSGRGLGRGHKVAV